MIFKSQKNLINSWIKEISSYKGEKPRFTIYDGNRYDPLGLLGRIVGIPDEKMLNATYLTDCTNDSDIINLLNYPYPAYMNIEQKISSMFDFGATYKDVAKFLKNYFKNVE